MQEVNANPPTVPNFPVKDNRFWKLDVLTKNCKRAKLWKYITQEPYGPRLGVSIGGLISLLTFILQRRDFSVCTRSQIQTISLLS